MIMHIVLLLPKPEATREELLAVLEKARALQTKIPGIVAMQAGENQNPNNQGYTFGMAITFDNEEHFKAYFPHPEHRAVGAELRRLSVNLLNFDIPV
jgi:antibiotic biosynthesis monooxygenase (ABM) superfamily enzyme